VVTLHNATLGAASGWGIPPFSQQLPPELTSVFAKQVRSRQRALQKAYTNNTHWQERIQHQIQLWSSRLIRPRLLKELHCMKTSLLVHELPLDQWHLQLERLSDLLSEQDRHRLREGKILAVDLLPVTDIDSRLQATFAWYLEKKHCHLSFITLLLSLLKVGEQLLQTGRAEFLVLPIIDKFFASSLRDLDLEFLPGFVEMLQLAKAEPLFLLVDDTARREKPSLQLAMAKWQRTLPFRGLGVFSQPENFLEPTPAAILAHVKDTTLFALRPFTEVHNPMTLSTLLATRPDNFLSRTGYDSAWKDELPFLYTGTQVEPFTGPCDQPEEFPPLVGTSRGPMLFGTYYRTHLRQLALRRLGLESQPVAAAGCSSELDMLWQEYARMANLL